MSSFRKHLAVPEEIFKSMQNANCEKVDRETVKRILKISLLLAKINGYNNQFNIRGRNGEFLENTNIIDLIEKIESEDSHLTGEDDFITLLSEAKVPLDLIVNERLKLKVSKQQNTLTVAPTFSSSFDSQPATEQSIEDFERESKYHDFFVPSKVAKKTTRKKVTKKDKAVKVKQNTSKKSKWIKV